MYVRTLQYQNTFISQKGIYNGKKSERVKIVITHLGKHEQTYKKFLNANKVRATLKSNNVVKIYEQSNDEFL